MTKRYVDVDAVVLVVVLLERSLVFFVVTFSNVVWRDHLRAARVFDKPVKARPRICLPLAFVTLLVLWLDSELTWKKGPRWYPEQTVRVCPGSTRRTPLSVTVACSPTANTQYRTDTFHRAFSPDNNPGNRPTVSLFPFQTDLSFPNRPNNCYETRRESLDGNSIGIDLTEETGWRGELEERRFSRFSRTASCKSRLWEFVFSSGSLQSCTKYTHGDARITVENIDILESRGISREFYPSPRSIYFIVRKKNLFKTIIGIWTSIKKDGKISCARNSRSKYRFTKIFDLYLF